MAFKFKMNQSKSTESRGMIQIGPDLRISRANHDKLRDHCVKLLEAWHETHGPCVQRFAQIDKEISGHMIPSSEDRKRIEDNRLGKGPKTIDEHNQFALMQLDEAVTYFLGVFADEASMYSAVAPREELTVANSLTALMNQHARVYKHYRHLALFFLYALKFNIAAIEIKWNEVRGKQIKGSMGAGPNIELDAVIRSGNELTAVDPYNFVYDPAYNPIDCPTMGQFMGYIDIIRPFTLEMMDAEKFYFNSSKLDLAKNAVRFWNSKPQINHQYLAGGATQTNWDSFWGNKYGAHSDGIGFDGTAIERANMYIRINPKRFGLAKDDSLQVWRIHMLNNEHIVFGEQQSNVHDLLPFAVSMPNEDGLNLQSRTFAEMLLPFQKFASSQLNLHQKASRKRLYGLTVYNRRVVPLLENEHLAGGKVPANATSDDFDIRRAVMQLNDAPDTTRTMQDVRDVLDLMQKMLPSVQPGQVASLERSTQYQAAAYVQATNRRNQKLAKLMNAQALDSGRRMQLQNILQYQSVVSFTDNMTGERVEINPEQLRGSNIEFTLSDGLKGMDKLLLVASLKDTIHMLLQSQVARDYDMGGIIDYFLELQGEKMDFTQFKYKSPIDALPPELKNLAFTLLQGLDQAQLQAALQQSQAQQSTQQAQQVALPTGG